MDHKYKINVDNLFKLKSDFENGVITENQISEAEHVALAYVYQIQEEVIKTDIAYKEKEIEDFKIRLKNAIDYLKTKK